MVVICCTKGQNKWFDLISDWSLYILFWAFVLMSLCLGIQYGMMAQLLFCKENIFVPADELNNSRREIWVVKMGKKKKPIRRRLDSLEEFAKPKAALVKQSICSFSFFVSATKTVGLVLFYYCFSITLTFYNQRFIHVSSGQANHHFMVDSCRSITV